MIVDHVIHSASGKVGLRQVVKAWKTWTKSVHRDAGFLLETAFFLPKDQTKQMTHVTWR